MELQQLKYFQAVARLEHMTRAAEELHITQPSLSITIARLEEDLGVPLFDRHGKQIKLNKFGKAFLRRVERVFAELKEGRMEVKDLAGLEQGTVSLASNNLGLLVDLLNSFQLEYPNVKFQLSQDTMPMMQQQLESGEVDFCISSPPLQGRGISMASLMVEEIILVVPKGHRLAERESIDLHEAANEPFINLKAGYGIRNITDQLCKEAGFTPRNAYELNDPLLIANLVKSGLGIAFMPINAWKGSISAVTIGLHIKEPSTQRFIGLTWLEERYLSVASRCFRQFVIDYFPQFEKKLKEGHSVPSLSDLKLL